MDGAGGDALHAYGPPLGRGRLRATPEDFVVVERLSFAPRDAGPHWLLRVGKRGANTAWVAGRLASYAGCRARDVGFAGRKDRHAVAEQWFSVPARRDGGPDWSGFADPECAVLEARRHDRKLRLGAVAGNRFVIVVRDCRVDAAALAARVAAVADGGAPNAFGAQRFGRAGDNAERGIRVLRGELAVADRRERGLYISALRSAAFNAVLAARVADGSWRTARPGECLMLDGTHSHFVADAVDATLERRLAELDVHPTGPLPGAGEARCRDAALAHETELLAPHAEAAAALAAARVEAERRALRVRVRELAAAVDGDALRFEFELPAGAFATVVLAQFVAFESAAEE